MGGFIGRYPPVGGGTDWSKYTITNGAAKAPATTYTTVLNVTGKGYLSKAIIKPNTTSGHTAQIKITVDGSLVHESLATYSLSTLTGLAALGSLYGSNLILNTTTESSSRLSIYPQTGAAETGVCFIYQPIFFNTSLTIDVLYTGTNTNAFYEYNAGVI